MPKTICRGGFEFGAAGFVVERSNVKRASVDELRSMFLPKLTPWTKKMMQIHRTFPKCQLQHYGINCDSLEWMDNGTRLLQKMLRDGKLDKVPGHIENLRLQMSAKWYDQLTLEEMARTCPDYMLKRYFLDASCRPDRTKTTEVLAVDTGCHKRKVLEAARNVSGLHCFSGFSRTGSSNTLYIGWDRMAVFDDSNNHEKIMQRKKMQKTDVRSQKRKSMHSDYLREAQAKDKKACSPVGKYIVDCAEIEKGFPEDGDLSLDLCESGEPDVYEAHFYFGPIKGIMILSHQKAVLDQYCLDHEKDSCYGDEDDESIENDSEEDEAQPAVGSKRKTVRGGGGPASKKAKSASAQPLQFFVKMKGRETGEGQIFCDVAEGVIKFDNSRFSKYARFTGVMDMEYVGDNVSFIARQVCGTPEKNQGSWSSYSESAWEHGRVARWH